MRQLLIFQILFFMAMNSKPLISQAQITSESVSFERVLGFPSSEEGIEKGVSACFAGSFKDNLLMAGGCNFPDKPAAEGGAKRYYRGIYKAQVTDKPVLDWKLIGHLPVECAYGVSVQLADGLLCIGGNNAKESFSQVLKIGIDADTAKVEALPNLPLPMDNFTGCAIGNQVYVYNGEHLFVLDLSRNNPVWKEKTISQKEKISQPVSASIKGKFYVWGGSTAKTEAQDATLRISGTCFDDVETPVPAPMNMDNEEIFLGGGAAISLSEELLLALGGVHKDVFLSAVNHPQPGYMTHEVSWYRFNPFVSVYDGHVWKVLAKTPITARAGTTLVKFKNDVYIIGGELKPGIRTPDIYRMNFCSSL